MKAGEGQFDIFHIHSVILVAIPWRGWLEGVENCKSIFSKSVDTLRASFGSGTLPGRQRDSLRSNSLDLEASESAMRRVPTMEAVSSF
ncbi:hypothetical protein PABG_12422 [Paracoccidioides brasiliensis Pb03]|uniref:Uncharacterized protein n=2 Tax=Paracoccidioides brasiliensis TaxID=121759 RepID=A0A0A0HVY8_PARBD|nr:uncharacterized protein PADG_11392 [Paracoccidioides brasiliensis Pb18]KGM92563.1 hypothetical protein PADG_11392 [Paracoccidioides brasiliensis Pb18]KGY14736.1 hypothetical protein PABG_12422 [Paracoccidioides brasiliensis Pb03]ODH45140.1 hypothetical protein ACO22_00344 [Paracoccidioides brasiliensis]ODH51573.1 hypothetical protein GX48_02242 [Paracoccidioides brasiliensis]